MIFQKYRLNEARDKTMKRQIQKRRESRKLVRKAKRDKNR